MSLRAGGVRPWVVQRVSAAYLGLFLALVFATLISSPIRDFVDWRERLSQPLINVGTILFFFALLIHAWIGMRDVVMDYMHNVALRFAVLSIVAMYLIAMAVWTVRILAGLW